MNKDCTSFRITCVLNIIHDVITIHQGLATVEKRAVLTLAKFDSNECDGVCEILVYILVSKSFDTSTRKYEKTRVGKIFEKGIRATANVVSPFIHELLPFSLHKFPKTRQQVSLHSWVSFTFCI